MTQLFESWKVFTDTNQYHLILIFANPILSHYVNQSTYISTEIDKVADFLTEPTSPAQQRLDVVEINQCKSCLFSKDLSMMNPPRFYTCSMERWIELYLVLSVQCTPFLDESTDNITVAHHGSPV